jgi:hypothetical protein
MRWVRHGEIRNYTKLENYPSRMMEKSKVVNTYIHKYYPIKPKIP